MEYLVLYAVVGSLSVFNALPLGLRRWFAYWMIRLTAFIKPKIRNVSLRNIEIVFPEWTREQKLEFLDKTYRSLAIFIVDVARFHTLDRKWIAEHVELPDWTEYDKLRAEHPGKGVILVGAHLGSIEILGLAWGMEKPMSAVARTLKQPKLEAWWRRQREKYGNEVIPRKGAVPRIIAALNNGREAALIMDQNVRSKHAVFVDWFGLPAATSFAPALAAVTTGLPMMLGCITYLGGDRYRITNRAIPTSHIQNDPNLTRDEKVLEITRIVSKVLQEAIMRSPEEWFWMHRRWHTRPKGEPETIYKDC